MTKNNQCKSLIDLSKVFAGWNLLQDADLKMETRPVTRTLKPDVVIQPRP